MSQFFKDEAGGGDGLAPSLCYLLSVTAFSGGMKRMLLAISTAAIFLGTPPIARAGCGEEDMQSELDEPKALTKSGFKSEFRDFVLREFPIGSDGGRLLRWLERSGYPDPNTTYLAQMSMSGDEYQKETAAANERQRQGRLLNGSIRSFSGLCGKSFYAVYWRLDKCNRIVELYTDEVRCRIDLP